MYGYSCRADERLTALDGREVSIGLERRQTVERSSYIVAKTTRQTGRLRQLKPCRLGLKACWLWLEPCGLGLKPCGLRLEPCRLRLESCRLRLESSRLGLELWLVSRLLRQ